MGHHIATLPMHADDLYRLPDAAGRMALLNFFSVNDLELIVPGIGMPAFTYGLHRRWGDQRKESRRFLGHDPQPSYCQCLAGQRESVSFSDAFPTFEALACEHCVFDNDIARLRIGYCRRVKRRTAKPSDVPNAATSKWRPLDFGTCAQNGRNITRGRRQ